MQFSVAGRDLAGAVTDAIAAGPRKVTLPRGYRLDWGGEYKEYTASRAADECDFAADACLIFLLLFALYSNFKFPFITVLGVLLSAPVGGLVALWITGTPFSVSSGIGFLALFGVSVQTASSTFPTSTNCAAAAPGRAKPFARAPSCGCGRS